MLVCQRVESNWILLNSHGTMMICARISRWKQRLPARKRDPNRPIAPEDDESGGECRQSFFADHLLQQRMANNWIIDGLPGLRASCSGLGILPGAAAFPMQNSPGFAPGDRHAAGRSPRRLPV